MFNDFIFYFGEYRIECNNDTYCFLIDAMMMSSQQTCRLNFKQLHGFLFKIAEL